ncbi:glycoside hydrolase family 3 C-terminal domain-containing protein [Salipaludibacillus agaradhaerens]|nr:glycoside hydrolase family 3 C-terminal domain-containing protein [Salipaludibacillus agaradhaerens]MCR6119783.1 glycoside hydrolase family 3 C-terminal domain-containing protein [Salipaludibacillus agaradhaerens]
MICSTLIMSSVYLNMSAVSGQENFPQLTDKESINGVIAAMTLEEKAALLVGGNTQELEDDEDEIIGDQAERVPGAAGETQAIERLGIPSIVLADGPMGVRIDPTREDDANTYYATKFPAPNALASTWDPELVYEVGKAVAHEAKEYGIDLLLAPGMNIQSYLLNGRNYEYFSEDPYVTGMLATAFVNGVQNQGIGTTLKHFAAYNQRADNTINAIVSQRALREIYLKGFEMAVKSADPWAVMASYNKINGTWATESEELLTSVLRQDWPFNGFVMTDWEFGQRDTSQQMNAGLNLLMPGREEQVESIVNAVQEGTLDERIVDRNVRDILEIIVETPTFLEYDHSDVPHLAANADVSRHAAADGMVLLKNDERTLPLKSGLTVSLFGTPQVEPMTGGRGSALVYPPYEVSIPEGLENKGFTLDQDLYDKYQTYVAELRATEEFGQIGEGIFDTTFPTLPEMDVAEEAIKAANESDVGIIILTSEFGSYGADRSLDDFYLSESKQKMIDDVSTAFEEAGKPVVVILNVEGPIEVVSWRDKVDAILLSWQPGQELGNAVSDVLVGEVNLAGKLPQTFPIDYHDLPYSDRYPGTDDFVYEEDIYVGYRYHTTFDLETAYEFGYGLSYTDFDYSNIRVNRNGKFKDKITVFATVENVGEVPGREVVQVYVKAPDGKLEKPELELKAFNKTKELQPGKKENLKFELDAKNLASFDENLSAWVLEKGTYEVKVGASSEDIKGTTTFSVKKDMMIEKVNDVLAPEVDFKRLSKRDNKG